MQQALLDAAKSSIPNLFVVSGLVFLFAALIGHYALATPVPRYRQIITGAVGIVLIVCGVAFYFLPYVSFQPGEHTVTIDARKGWQSSDFQATAGITLHIQVIAGQWRNGLSPYNSGEGTGYICGHVMIPGACVEALPSAPSDALIGSIGTQLFLVGQGTTLTPEQSGLLELKINDGPNGLYDNDGALTVSIYSETNPIQ